MFSMENKLEMAFSAPPCSSFPSEGSSSSPMNSLRKSELQSSTVRDDEEKKKYDNCEGVMRSCVEGNVLIWPLSKLKRKRPTRLEIPSGRPLLDIEKLTTEELKKEMYVQGSDYSVACKKGCRKAMEDAYSAITDISGYSDQVGKCIP